MISIEDRKQFARAEQKAREVKPRVSMVEYGTYNVASSQPDKDPYTIKFSKDTADHWQAECNCQAHTKSKGGPKACFHIPAAYHCHKIQVGIRQQVRAALVAAPAPAPVYFCPCGVEMAQPASRCETCLLEKDRQDIFG